MNERKAFSISRGKGFHMTLPNGYVMSVQFGPGNYCDHYNRGIGRDEEDCGKEGSDQVECAVLHPITGDLIELPSEGEYKDTVAGYLNVEEFWKLQAWAAALPVPVAEAATV